MFKSSLKLMLNIILVVSLCVSCAYFNDKPYSDLLEKAVSGESRETIVILYSPVGAGHISAAKTIRSDLLKKNPKLNIVLTDITHFGFKLLKSKKLYKSVDEFTYFTVFNHFPNIYTKLFDKNMKSNVKQIRLHNQESSINKTEFRDFLKTIAEKHPISHILSTHYMGARALGSLKTEGFFNSRLFEGIRVSWVDTDYFVGYFPKISQYLDMTFLAHKQLKDIWIKRGVPNYKVINSGMPISLGDKSNFKKKTKREFLEDLGMSYDDQSIIITIATGGSGVGDFSSMVESIRRQFANSPYSLKILAVPAKDRKNYRQLKRLKKKLRKKLELKVFQGFIKKNDLLSYINNSDVYITKAGGLSPTEAFLINKPVVLLNLFGGHEKENARFFNNLNLAEVVDEYSEIGKSVYKIIVDKDRQAQILAAQRKFAKNLHRERITDFLLSPRPVRKKISNDQIIKNVLSSSDKGLKKLAKEYPSQVEVFLSYTLSDNQGNSVNPFGHLALRIKDKVYTTTILARDKKLNYLMKPLSLKEFLYAASYLKANKKEQKDMGELSDTFGQLWGRDVLAMRLNGFSDDEINRMQVEIDNIQTLYRQGKLKYSEFTSNCSHHVLKIFDAGEITANKKHKELVQVPLMIFKQIHNVLKRKGIKSKFVFYQQVYEKDKNILPEFKFSLSKYPLNLNLYQILKWYTLNKLDPQHGDIEMNADLRLSYYPGGRVVFEDVDHFTFNDFVEENERRKTNHKTVIIPTFDDGPFDRGLWSKKAKFCPSEKEFLKPLNEILATLKSLDLLGVFYVNGWGNIDLDANCETRTREGLSRIFRKGLKVISNEGHIIGLHSFTHDAYRKKGFSKQDIKNDIMQLQTEIKEADLKKNKISCKNKSSISPLWRTPYGSHEDKMFEISMDMDLVPRLWKIDSLDYLAHDDSPVRFLFKKPLTSYMANQVGFAVSSQSSSADTKDPYLDILFHVNRHTSKNLHQLLYDIQSYLEKNKRAKFTEEGGEGDYFWSSSLEEMEVRKYVCGRFES